ncbi:MAG: hypothetical protein AABO58_07530 [Acidobacteriota bacterium]
MACREMVVGLLLIVAIPIYADGATPVPFKTCVEQKQGHTSDQPPDPVVICQRLFPSAPFVRLPQDRRAPDGQATINGVVELDIGQRPGTNYFYIQNARFYDRDLTLYDLIDSAGKPIDETSPLMQKNHLPSNRVHFLVYEAIGKVMSPAASGANKRLQLTGLRPVVLVDGRAIDERLLGPWEGSVSKRRSDDQWFTDDNPAHFAKIRIQFEPPLIPYENIGVLSANPKLADGTRFKALGKIENATQPIRLSTGACAPALNSYGAANPFPDRVATSDYSIKMWRFPAMHTLWSKDFHIVLDYPKGLYPSASAMARDHNFRLKDYIAKSTKPKDLVFILHGNPINQILFTLKPVQGGGGHCP